MKKKNTKLKVLGVAAAMVMVMGATAVTTWAFTRTNYESNFKATFVGSRNVEATIDAASYLSSNPTEALETTSVEFTKTSSESTKTASFTNAVAVINAGDYAYYDFKVTNKSQSNTYTDLIVEPSVTETNESVITSMYYAVGEGEYKALTEDYLTIHQTEDVTIRVIANVVDGAEDVVFEGKFNLNLNTEIDKPEGYTQDYTYRVDGTTAYRTAVCTTCGEAGVEEKMKDGSYVIATPETAQSILDQNINGKVVIFTGTEYNEQLVLRPSKYQFEAYSYSPNENYYKLGTKVEYEDLQKDSTIYHYTRNINNVTFTAVEGVKFNKSFKIFSTTYRKTSATDPDVGVYDAVREMWCNTETNGCYLSHLAVENVIIKNMDFVSEDAILEIYVAGAMENSYVKNMTIEDCNFYMTGEYLAEVKKAAIKISSDTMVFENITVRNNIVDGHYQGVYLGNVVNATIDNNSISNTGHNAVALHGHSYTNYAGETINGYYGGDILIVNNKISNLNDRAIRFGEGDNADIIIGNNTFIAAVDSDREIVKAEISVETYYVFINNTYADTEDDNAVYLPNQTGMIDSTEEYKFVIVVA